ncbi:S1/P1 nuclease [Flavobacterium sp.]|uniref:S1/P1 nuclease n=1 Tax=Flavobacterium sp. TaxID=239 RepID=UPI0037B3B79D
MNKNYLFAALLVTVMFFPIKTLAWGKKGHALVAEIAFSYLDENTKKTVLEYLDGTSIEDAANWMDNVRSNHSYDYLKPYHYVDFERNEAVVETSGDNLIYKLDTTIKELKNRKNLSNEEIKTKIEIIFHLIGDLHQPLHVGYSSDKGGNSLQLRFNDKGTNLHSLWDSGIIESKEITFEDCLKEQFSKRDLRKLSRINVLNWAKESRVFLDQVYNTGGNKITDEYTNTNAILIESQIHKAGIRLASVLKYIFKN